MTFGEGAVDDHRLLRIAAIARVELTTVGQAYPERRKESGTDGMQPHICRDDRQVDATTRTAPALSGCKGYGADTQPGTGRGEAFRLHTLQSAHSTQHRLVGRDTLRIIGYRWRAQVQLEGENMFRVGVGQRTRFCCGIADQEARSDDQGDSGRQLHGRQHLLQDQLASAGDRIGLRDQRRAQVAAPQHARGGEDREGDDDEERRQQPESGDPRIDACGFHIMRPGESSQFYTGQPQRDAEQRADRGEQCAFAE